MTELTIRRAVPADAAGIAEICTTSLGYECGAEFVEKRLNELEGDSDRIFVAVSGDRVIGFIHAQRYTPLYFDTLVNILGIAVANDCKRCGAGRKLMQAAEEWAREINAAGVRLNSGGTRTGAHDFYRALGFNDEKTQLRFIKDVKI